MRNQALGWFPVWLFVLSSSLMGAPSSVRYEPGVKTWLLDAGDSTYVMGVNERGELQSVYWGPSIKRVDDFAPVQSERAHASFDLSTTTTPQEYPGWGAGLFSEPALKATFGNGNREVILHYVKHEIHGNTLIIQLKDVGSALTVSLNYEVYPDLPVIRRSAHIENATNEPIVIESAQSAAWTLPAADDYEMHYLTGAWGREWQYRSEPLKIGTRVLESRRGSTGDEVNPWFAISQNAGKEENGSVWFGALGWSGSWKITVEHLSVSNLVRITGGYNTFDFEYSLAAGESLDTPDFYGGYTGKGIGSASRYLHTFERNYILPRGAHRRVRPVLYNSWEATQFNVNEAGQLALAERAAKLGVERFVIDDGWFGERNNDKAGLGDWWVNKQKFPHGLKPVIDRVHSLGMDFGIWVEPEMVNPDSELYRKHPDWVMNFPGRERVQARNQLVLNLAREDVKNYVFATLDKLVSENDIAFLKWDYNRNWSEPGWPEAPLADQKKIWVKYVWNLYDIIDQLRAKHPNLEIESCSGGGGRVDLGILRRTEEVWPSDNTDAFDRLSIQYGFTHAYTPDVMMDWVTDSPNGFDRRAIPLKFRFLVAMNGALGIGGDLNRWTDQDNALATKLTAYYKQIRNTVQQGELYRLFFSGDDNQVANEYISQDGREIALFAFLGAQHLGLDYPVVHLRGLDEQALYRLVPLDQDHLTTKAEILSGAYLMNHGVSLRLQGDYDSTAIVFKKITAK